MQVSLQWAWQNCSPASKLPGSASSVGPGPMCWVAENSLESFPGTGEIQLRGESRSRVTSKGGNRSSWGRSFYVACRLFSFPSESKSCSAVSPDRSITELQDWLLRKALVPPCRRCWGAPARGQWEGHLRLHPVEIPWAQGPKRVRPILPGTARSGS